MSGGSKNNKKKVTSQRHQNKTAFKIVFDTQALQMQKKVSLTNLCKKCHQVMEWKLQFNKYKKATQVSRCNICTDKSVYRSYMNACQRCCDTKNVCAKCLTPDYELPETVKHADGQTKKIHKEDQNNQDQFIKTLKERSRRSVRRGIEKGKISWDSEEQYFVDQQGKKLTTLHFRSAFSTNNSQIDEDQDSNADFSDQQDGQACSDDENDLSQKTDSHKNKNFKKKTVKSDKSDKLSQSGKSSKSGKSDKSSKSGKSSKSDKSDKSSNKQQVFNGTQKDKQEQSKQEGQQGQQNDEDYEDIEDSQQQEETKKKPVCKDRRSQHKH